MNGPDELRQLADRIADGWMLKESEMRAAAVALRRHAEVVADNVRLRESLSILAEATTIADAVPDVRRFARDALAATPTATPDPEGES